MSYDLTLWHRAGLPAAPERPAPAPRPAPPAGDPPTLEASTTYDPHDRVPLADGEAEC